MVFTLRGLKVREKLLAHLFVSWITLSMLAGGVAACSKPPSDETRLRQAVADMEKAAEAKQLNPILAYLGEDFLGNHIYRKANMSGMLVYQFHRNQHVHVFLHITGLTIKADHAQLRCEVLLAGRGQQVVPDRARVLVIKSDWRKRDGKWQVMRASWKDPLSQS